MSRNLLFSLIAAVAVIVGVQFHLAHQLSNMERQTRSEIRAISAASVDSKIQSIVTKLQTFAEQSMAMRASIDQLATQWNFASPADGGHNHVDARLFMIRSNLAQSHNHIVFVGDSITEAAHLPSEICGHDVVNAGIGGANSKSYLKFARQLFDEEKPPVVVVAIGTNDAQKASKQLIVQSRYPALVDYLSSRAKKVILIGVPPMDMNGVLAKGYFSETSSGKVNDLIEHIAGTRNLDFVDLRASMVGNGLTVDGIHLSAAGYELWTKAVIGAVKKVACPMAEE